MRRTPLTTTPRCVLTRRCLNGTSEVTTLWRYTNLFIIIIIIITAPPYLADGVRRATDVDGRRHPRSTALVVPPVRRSTLGDRAFPVAAP